MRPLQFAKKAILILLLSVLVLDTSGDISALSISSGFASGVSTIKTLSLEDDYAVLASSPDSETALSMTPTTSSVTSTPPITSPIPPSSDTIAIYAINPGYNLESGKNTGEMIELINLTSSAIALDNLALIYTTKPSSTYSNGKSTILYYFPTGSRFVEKTILLRYFDAPEVLGNTQDLVYDTSLAMAGTLSLVILPAEFDETGFSPDAAISTYGEIINTVCWIGGELCLPNFSTTVKSRSYTTILRDLVSGEYHHVNDYKPLYNPDLPGLYLPPDLPTDRSDESFAVSTSTEFNPTTSPICTGLEFSEILSYYVDDATEQFIELYNSTSRPLQIHGCKIRYKKKLYDLASSPTTVPPSGYYVYHPEITLTKNPASENLYELLDINGDLVDAVSLPHGQKSSTSYAVIDHSNNGAKNWQITYLITPGLPNIYQEFRTCPAGKVINESTGNCVNVATLNSTLKDCEAGKYRNPLTGRCKSYDSDESTDLTPCKEGYERNPETNRCRKISSNNGADYPVVPITDIEENSSFIALWAIGAIALLGIGYIFFQFRREIYYFFRKLLAKIKRK